MKKIVLSFIISLFSLILVFSQDADKILGLWLTQEKDSQVQIYKGTDGKYYGKIVWLQTPLENGKPKVDDQNPKKSLQNRPIMGLLLLVGFKFDKGDNEWNDGTIYDPNNGSTYDCYMWFEKNDLNTLHVKGYIGFAIIGRQVEWTREQQLRKQQ